MTANSVTIVGAGHAAGQLVASLRMEGFTGAVTLIGEEPHLPYQRPPLSKKFLTGEAGIDTVTLRPKDYYVQSRIELRLGVRVAAIDRGTRTLRLATGEALSYETLVLATGTRARALPVAGAALPNVVYLRGIDDSLFLKNNTGPGVRLVVIGGGYIGLEVAASAVKLGASVTVVEALPRLMARVSSPEISTYYAAVHKQAGVSLRLDVSVAALAGTDRVREVVLADGQTIAADLVLVGIGAVPNVELAKDAGLEIGNGIVVDPNMRTSDPAILAIGDCTDHWSPPSGKRIRLESVQNAVDQAHTAVKTILGTPEPYDKVPWFWSDQYDEQLQIAGHFEPGDEIILRRHSARSFALYHVRDGALRGVEAVNAAKDYMIGRRLMETRASVRLDRLSDPKAGLRDLQS